MGEQVISGKGFDGTPWSEEAAKELNTEFGKKSPNNITIALSENTEATKIIVTLPINPHYET
jgi:hypothetical protein